MYIHLLKYTELHFKQANDKQYQGLYEQARQLPNVNYIGYKPNEYIKEHLQRYHMFAYPSIFGKKHRASRR
jgi:glycosyltransferase involved in cell wall biosynthesis